MASYQLNENRKLQKFLAIDRPPRKRIRAALDFLRTGPNDLISIFWEEHTSTVYSVLGSCIAELEVMYLPHPSTFGIIKKKQFDQDDWADIFEILEHLIKESIDNIQRGWQNTGFNGLFSKLLKSGNNSYIRCQGFRCLLLFIEGIIDQGFEGPHIKMLRDSIDFSPYASSSVQLPEREMDYIEGWEREGPTPPEEPVNMFKFLLDFSLEDSHAGFNNHFEFWCEVLMKIYFPLLYPKVCLRTNLKDDTDRYGFFHHCPGSFQRLLARWIYKLKTNQRYFDVIWSKEAYIDVFLEILRQRFLYRDVDLVMDALRLYQGWIDGSVYIPRGMQGVLQEVRCSMISHVSYIFSPDAHFDDSQHLDIVLNAIYLYEAIALSSLNKDTFAYLRKSLIASMDRFYCETETPITKQSIKKFVSVVYRVWMYNICTNDGLSESVWKELSMGTQRWLENSEIRNQACEILIDRWKFELFLVSYVMMINYSPEATDIVIGQVDSPSIIVLKDFQNRNKEELQDEKNPNSKSKETLQTRCNIKGSDDALLLFDRVLNIFPPDSIIVLPQDLLLLVLEAIHDVLCLWLDIAIAPEATFSHPINSSSSTEAKSNSRSHLKPKLSHDCELRSITPETMLMIFEHWLIPCCDFKSPVKAKTTAIAMKSILRLAFTRCDKSLSPPFVAKLSHLICKGLNCKSTLIRFTVIQYSCEIFSMDIKGINVLIPLYIRTLVDMMDPSFLRKNHPVSSNVLDAMLSCLLSIMSFPIRYPAISFSSIENLKEKNSKDLNDIEFDALNELLEDLPDEFDLVLLIGDSLIQFIDRMEISISIKQRALWGLYTLVTMNLLSGEERKAENGEGGILKTWVLFILQKCNAKDTKLSVTAINVMSSLSDYYEEVLKRVPSTIPHILMTLSLMAQQQIEEASVEVQKSLEKYDAAVAEYEALKASVDKRKGRKGEENSAPPASPDIPALESITTKTAAIFDCMRVWLMVDTSKVLNDPKVCRIIFSAIEAALIGKLPDGQWQEQVEAFRNKKGKSSMPLLFLGLQMRSSLERDRHRIPLKCFTDTSIAAEGLLLHLLHHFNNFPSPAGPDHLSSTCTEFAIGSEASMKSRSFFYMGRMIITLIGSKTSERARIVVRDMTGAYTWDLQSIYPDPECPEAKPLEEPSIPSENKVSNISDKKSLQIRRINVGEDDFILKIAQVDLNEDEKPLLIDSSVLPSSGQSLHPERSDEEDAGALMFEDESENSESDSDLERSYRDSIIEDRLSAASGTGSRNILNIYEMGNAEPGIGSLDGERSMLDLLMDCIPLKFPDCGGTLIDKTILGGKYTLKAYEQESNRFYYIKSKKNRQLLLEKARVKSSLKKSKALEVDSIEDIPVLSSEIPGLSFLHRLIHDDELYSKFRQFLASEDMKKYVEFCDAVRKYDNSTCTDARLSQASLIYWEFLSSEGRRQINFPIGTSRYIQNHIQEKKVEDGLFQDMITYLAQNDLAEALSKLSQIRGISEKLHLYREFNVLEHTLWIYEAVIQRQFQENAPYSVFQPCLPAPTAESVSSIDQCRLFLSQIGFLLPAGGNQIQLLDESPNLTRSIKHLDASPSRETMKIGVVYVGPGQTEQKEILFNTNGSPEYEEFIRGLGWEVDLTGHLGFSGGLDTNPKTLTNGKTALYFANSSTEVIYHVVTQMPTKETDTQQIDKKRHVGNDYVHIVWSDNLRNYFPHTISSNFNDVQIVIHPLCHSHISMYRIQVFSKTTVPTFGPLLSGMTVCKSDLPRLVRQTAINANRLCRSKTSIYRPPYPTRERILQEISDRYTSGYSDKELMESLLSIN